MLKCLLTSLVTLAICTYSSYAVDIYSRANGNWNNGNSWSTVSHNGPACNCTPSSADNIYINHNITLTKSLTNQGSNQNGITALLEVKAGAALNGGNNYDLDIRSTGTFVLCGSVTAKDIIFSNGSSILICSNATLNINGNFENKNNSNNVTINGTMNVGGSFSNGTGGVITGSGIINITNGPVTNNGSTMGCTGNLCSSFPCSISGPCSAPLPVELIEFDGLAFNNYIRIYWTTASEKNNEYFILEKSLDGKTFSELSKIKGNGNTSVTQNYAYRDLYPVSGTNYYRLKQFDFDGQMKTYDIIQVYHKFLNILSVHPNPTAGKALNISLNSDNREASVTIIDINGVIVYSSILKFDKTTNIKIEEIKNLPQGVYTLLVQSTEGILQEKLLVTN